MLAVKLKIKEHVLIIKSQKYEILRSMWAHCTTTVVVVNLTEMNNSAGFSGSLVSPGSVYTIKITIHYRLEGWRCLWVKCKIIM